MNLMVPLILDHMGMVVMGTVRNGIVDFGSA
jgi:hypothetical protein